jgi:DNA-directed RNA polymerase subunit RPC12/RpoP
MPIQITCAMCGGQIEPDDLALRRELITCPYCSTLNRITPVGTEKSFETIRSRQVPEEVKVKRNGTGQALFYVKGQRFVPPKTMLKWFFLLLSGVWFVFFAYLFLTRRENISISSISSNIVAFTLLCTYIFPLLFIGFLIVLSVLGNITSYLPPVKLDGDIITPSENVTYWGKKYPTPVKDIRQIYTVARHSPHLINRPPIDSVERTRFRNTRYFYRESYSVYALTLDGQRVPLIDHIFDGNIALYIEELLEVETGIFDLPVYGDQNLPRDIRTKIPLETSEKLEIHTLNCKSCGAPLPFSPDTPQRGYLVCQYCRVLALLYTPENKPVLGLSELNSPTSQFKLVKRGELIHIRPRNQKERHQILLLSKTHLGLRTFKGRGASFAFSEIIAIYAKEHEEAETMFTAFKLKFANDEGVGDEMAYSSDLDKTIKRIRGELFYQIVAKSLTGSEIILLDKIRNPHEALVLIDFLLKIYK